MLVPQAINAPAKTKNVWSQNDLHFPDMADFLRTECRLRLCASGISKIVVNTATTTQARLVKKALYHYGKQDR